MGGETTRFPRPKQRVRVCYGGEERKARLGVTWQPGIPLRPSSICTSQRLLLSLSLKLPPRAGLSRYAPPKSPLELRAMGIPRALVLPYRRRASVLSSPGDLSSPSHATPRHATPRSREAAQPGRRRRRTSCEQVPRAREGRQASSQSPAFPDAAPRAGEGQTLLTWG